MYDVNQNKKEIDGTTPSKYYGQWETDKFIEEYFPNKPKGLCIEVGAADGIKGSNTKYFEDLGWDVLCIEPNVRFADSLNEHRKLVRYYAVGNGNDKDQQTLTIFDVGEKNIMSSLSSLKPDQRLVEAHEHIINGVDFIDVPVRTLPFILENTVEDTPFHQATKIDFISIDTEGTELDVLHGFDFESYNVELFVVENNYSDPEIEDFMKEKGYILHKRWKINDFYVKGL
tara:strand:- start:775 stop:1461 length:687 start_codon:yes stop_codon:yes gene_type:complete